MAAQTKKKFPLRINPALWKELERWSQDELRSMNGQVEFLLNQAVKNRNRDRTAEEDTH